MWLVSKRTALVQREPKPRGPYDHEDCSWLVMDVGLGPADKAIEVTYDDHFLQRAHDDRLLNVASWHMSAGSLLVTKPSRATIFGCSSWPTRARV